jgi:Ca2+-binding RTX toxin-like protein
VLQNCFTRPPIYESDGSNEFDTLTGGSGRDKFVLSTYRLRRSGAIPAHTFYIGPGFATIRNFTQGQDSIEYRAFLRSVIGVSHQQ